MNIKKIEDNNIEKLAKFMSCIKPEWWDFEGALAQLKKGIGWYIEKKYAYGLVVL